MGPVCLPPIAASAAARKVGMGEAETSITESERLPLGEPLLLDDAAFRRMLLQQLQDPKIAAMIAAAAASAGGSTDSEGGVEPPTRAVTGSDSRRDQWVRSSGEESQASRRTMDALGDDAVERMLSSHFTMTAWLLTPTHDGMRARKVEKDWHVLTGLVAAMVQALIVHALIADLIDKERQGNSADDLLGDVQGLAPGSTIIAREMSYCRDETSWAAFVTERLALTASAAAGIETNTSAESLMCWPPDYCKELELDEEQWLPLTLVDEANARHGYLNSCWEAWDERGKAISGMEVVTDIVLTLFLAFEIYSEQQQLFLQALLFHAVPTAATGSSGGGMQPASMPHILHSIAYVLFIGYRLYFLGLVSLASAILIVADAGIADACLNGMALLFIIDFDERLWQVGKWGYHSLADSDGGDFRAEYKRVFTSASNIRALLRVQESGTLAYACITTPFTFLVALWCRRTGALYSLASDEVLGDRSAFSGDSVVMIWENVIGSYCPSHSVPYCATRPQNCV